MVSDGEITWMRKNFHEIVKKGGAGISLLSKAKLKKFLFS